MSQYSINYIKVLAFLFFILSFGSANSQSDLQTYTPSKLLEKGKMDFKLYNNFYTGTRYIGSEDSSEVVTVPRGTFFTSTFEYNIGISENSVINVGFIANLKSNSSNNNALDVFRFESVDSISRAGLTSIAPSIKISPFKKMSNFSFQSSFHIPIFKEISVKDGGVYLDYRSYRWENKFFFDKLSKNKKFQFFMELDITYIFGDSVQTEDVDPDIYNWDRFANNSIAFPVSVFASYFINETTTVFANAQHYTLKGDFEQNFTLAGIGMKKQLTDKLNIELSSAYFLRGKESGLGETYNLGLRYIL